MLFQPRKTFVHQSAQKSQ